MMMLILRSIRVLYYTFKDMWLETYADWRKAIQDDEEHIRRRKKEGTL